MPGITVRLADVVVSKKAVMVTDVLADTEKVVTLKVAEVWPAGTFTTPGTWAAPLLLVARVIEAPPEGAGALKKTVPVALVPPLTLAGVMEID